jgi:hypothetical protein
VHIYVFGSIVRGEVDLLTDVDLLAVVESELHEFDPEMFSIYRCDRIKELWKEGNPFAWHLHLESVLAFASDNTDFIKELGRPAPYANARGDCQKFFNLFVFARAALLSGSPSIVFEYSNIFLALRNFATCYSLGMLSSPCFSRDSALKLGVDSLNISLDAYQSLKNCRILATRGIGEVPNTEDQGLIDAQFGRIEEWMSTLLAKVNN